MSLNAQPVALKLAVGVVSKPPSLAAQPPMPRAANTWRISVRSPLPWSWASVARIASRMSRKSGSPGERRIPPVISRRARMIPSERPCAAIRRERRSHRVWVQISPSKWTSGPDPEI